MWNVLINRMIDHPILPQEEILALTKQISSENKANPKIKTEAKERLFSHLLRRVAEIADQFYAQRVHYFGKFCDFDDLFNEGAIALWRVINRIGLKNGYRLEGAPFIIYASNFIFLQLKCFLARRGVRSLVFVCIGVEIRDGKKQEFEVKTNSLLARDNTLEDLAEIEIINIIRSERKNHELTQRERIIIKTQYPPSGIKKKSLRDLAREEGVSGKAYSQSHLRTLKKLKRSLMSRYPKTFSET